MKKKAFLVTQRQMLVICVMEAPLEHSLTYNGLWPTSVFFLVCLWTHSRSARLQKVWTIKDLLDGLINTVFYTVGRNWQLKPIVFWLNYNNCPFIFKLYLIGLCTGHKIMIFLAYIDDIVQRWQWNIDTHIKPVSSIFFTPSQKMKNRALATILQKETGPQEIWSHCLQGRQTVAHGLPVQYY